MNLTDRLSGYNPLRGLDLDGLVSMIENGERGYYADLQWLYRLVLRRNATARAVRRKLKGALGRLDWDIKLREDADGFDKALAEKQAAALHKAYETIRNFSRATAHLAMSDILGFSHLQKVYAGAPGADPALRKLPRDLDPWAIVELRPVPQWNLCREGLFAPWQYNADARSTNRGAPIDAAHWIIREVDDPAAEIFAFSHVKMAVSDADWDQFCDTYAVPPIFIEGPPNVPKGREGEYQTVAESIVSDGRGYLPSGSKVHTITAGTNDGSAFTARLRYYREEIVLAGTGGILTTLDGNTGIGKGPAEEHDDTWLDIAAEIGASVSAALNEDFDDPLLDRLFPDQPHFAYFELRKPAKDTSPTIVLEDAKAAMDAGYAMDAEELSEKTGYKLTAIAAPSEPSAPARPANAEPAPAVEPAAPAVERAGALPSEVPPIAPPEIVPVRPAANPKPSMAGEAKPSIVAAALAESVGVEERWLAPVKERLDALETLIADGADPAAIVAEIEKITAELPDLLGQLEIAEFADALEAATGPAAIAGVRDAISARRATA